MPGKHHSHYNSSFPFHLKIKSINSSKKKQMRKLLPESWNLFSHQEIFSVQTNRVPGKQRILQKIFQWNKQTRRRGVEKRSDSLTSTHLGFRCAKRRRWESRPSTATPTCSGPVCTHYPSNTPATRRTSPTAFRISSLPSSLPYLSSPTPAPRFSSHPSVSSSSVHLH